MTVPPHRLAVSREERAPADGWGRSGARSSDDTQQLELELER